MLASEAVVQHAPSRQADHLDQPVDGDAMARNREIAPRLQGQRRHPEINIAGQATVEPHLRFGIAPPGFG